MHVYTYTYACTHAHTGARTTTDSFIIMIETSDERTRIITSHKCEHEYLLDCSMELRNGNKYERHLSAPSRVTLRRWQQQPQWCHEASNEKSEYALISLEKSTMATATVQTSWSPHREHPTFFLLCCVFRPFMAWFKRT